MTTIREELAPFAPEMFFGDIRLSQWMYQFGLSNKGAAVLSKLFSKASGADINNPYPDMNTNTVIAMCDALGIQTTEQYIALVELLNSFNPDDQAFAKLLAQTPDIDYTSLTTCTPQFIADSVKAKYKTIDLDSNWWFDDSEYKLLTRESLDKISKKYPSKKYEYLSTSRDCDDFARILRGYLSAQAMGNLSIGAVSIVFFREDYNATYAHKLNIVVFEDGSVSLYEPQTNKLVEPESLYTTDTVDYLIYRLEF